MFDIEKGLILNGEEMTPQAVAETAGAMAEAPCGCSLMCFVDVLPQQLSYHALSSRKVILLLGLASQSISNFHHDISSDSVPLTGGNLPWSSTTCESGTGWSAQRYAVKCQFCQENRKWSWRYACKLLEGSYFICSPTFLLQEVRQTVEKEVQKDACHARALVNFNIVFLVCQDVLILPWTSGKIKDVQY